MTRLHARPSIRATRATRAIAHLGEVDPALAVLALWCRHRDGTGATRTDGDVITFGPDFDHLGLPEQVGLVAHHVLHVALRHSFRQAALAERLGDAFDPALFGLAADGITNETLILVGHAIPRPAVTLIDLLAEAGIPAQSPVAALEQWDVDRLAMALHSDPKRAKRLRDWGRARGFAVDLGTGTPKESGLAEDGKAQTASDWRNHVLHAFEAGRKAGSGIGRLGAILADLIPDSVPWEVHLRGILARALTERPRSSWRRPSGSWVARTAQAAISGGPTPVFEPGRQRMDQRPRIVIGIDTSSSITAQTLRLFTAEACAIARRTGAETHLLAFDEVVFTQTRLDPNGWNGLRDGAWQTGAWQTGAWRTGGGTDFNDLFVKAAKLHPSIAVILTDLDATLPPAPGFAVVWAVPGAVTPPPYGRVVRVGDAQMLG